MTGQTSLFFIAAAASCLCVYLNMPTIAAVFAYIAYFISNDDLN